MKAKQQGAKGASHDMTTQRHSAPRLGWFSLPREIRDKVTIEYVFSHIVRPRSKWCCAMFLTSQPCHIIPHPPLVRLSSKQCSASELTIAHLTASNTRSALTSAPHTQSPSPRRSPRTRPRLRAPAKHHPQSDQQFPQKGHPRSTLQKP